MRTVFEIRNSLMKFFKVIVGVTTHKQIIDFINDIVKHLNDLTEDVADIPDLIEDMIAAHKPKINWGKLDTTENKDLMKGTVDVDGDNYTLNLTVPYCECLYSNIRFKYEDGKIWVSFNGGKTWYDLMDVLPGDNDGNYTEGVFGAIKFKVEDGHVWVSYDGGATWEDLGQILDSDNIDFSNIKIEIDDDYLYYSIDGGETWINVGFIGTDSSIIKPGDTFDVSNLKLKIENNHLYFSTDGGNSWSDIGSVGDGNSNNPNGSIDLSDLQFKIENNNLKVSYDNGSSWTDLGRVVGQDGKDGASGGEADLKNIKIKVENNTIKISYDGGSSWEDAGTVTGGSSGDNNGNFDTSGIIEFTNEEDTTGVITSGAVRIKGGLSVNKTIWANYGIWSSGYVSALGQNTSSDERLKDILYTVNLSVEDIAKAPNIEFKWKSNGNLAVGSIAQYWKNILPNAVHENSNGYLEMEYGNIALSSVISLANEVLELRETVKKLQKQLNY